LEKLAQALERALTSAFALVRWLILPIALCLFLQWPLRDVVQAYSRPVNDAGQVLFAFYVAVAVAAATAAGAHLTPGNLSGRYSPSIKRAITIAAGVLVVVPWAGFVLWSGWPVMANALASLEHFQDTGNPGYFLIKLALGLLAIMVLAAAAAGIARAVAPDRRHDT
jgi:TRAP-type mannitol/chloroaromatic compound transport system permease small subunit